MGNNFSCTFLSKLKANKESKELEKKKSENPTTSTSSSPNFGVEREDALHKGSYLHNEKIVVKRKVFVDLKKKFQKRGKKKTPKGSQSKTKTEKNPKEEKKTEKKRTRSAKPPESVEEEIMEIFERIDKLDFDIFRLSELTNYHPLMYVTYALLYKTDCVKNLGVSDDEIIKFLVCIERYYDNNNPYFNSTLAAEHMQCLNYLLRKGLNVYLGDEDVFVAIMACMTLYMAQPALDNVFQRNVESFASTIYNDLATLQNVSLKKFFDILDNEVDIMASLADPQKKLFRTHLIESVVSTDFNEFQRCINEIVKATDSASDFSNKEDVKALLQLSVIFASLSPSIRPKKIFLKWTKQLMLQFITQGEVEKKLKLSVNKLGQGVQEEKEIVDFFDRKVKPVLKMIVQLFPQMKFINNFYRKNRSFIMNLENGVSLFKIRTNPQAIEYHVKQQETLEKRLRAEFGFPEDRKLNVSVEIQRKNSLKPLKSDTGNEKYCITHLAKRWDINFGRKRKIITKEPRIYALTDFKDLEKDLTDEEKRESIIAMFERIDEWNFDCFALTKLLGNDCLMLVTYVLFLKYDFIKRFRMDEGLLWKFLLAVRNGYHRNPYHNQMHACDVMQITNSIVKKSGMIHRISEVDFFAAILASLVHDLDHPGFNDAFQVNSYSYLAKLYNDRSVLEAHHCSETYRYMRENGLDFLKNMDRSEKMDMRKTMADMIISTDMSNHAKYVKAFNDLIEKDSDFTKKDHIRVALQIVIKMADISNPSRPMYIYLQWTSCIIEEFFRQGDAEKKYKLPVSPLMDRKNSVLSKGQKAFMEYVLIPMFKSFASIFKGAQFLVKRIQDNMEFWKENTEIGIEYFVPGNKYFYPRDEKMTMKEISTLAVEGNRNLYSEMYEREEEILIEED